MGAINGATHLPDVRGPHPAWCDPAGCATYPTRAPQPAYVLHARTIGDHQDCVVELLQREIVDATTGRSVRREPARVIVTCGGAEELNLHAEKAEEVGVAIARAAVLARGNTARNGPSDGKDRD